MPAYQGQLLTIDLVLTVWGVKIKVEGTVEVLGVRRKIDNESSGRR
jgi:hypothetical protein